MQEKMIRSGIIVALVILFILVYVQATPDNTIMLPTGKTTNSLQDEIIEKSTEYEEAPQDAYIDRVWKKTAGRNGLKVNVKKSYEKMKQGNVFDEKLLVYDDIPPEIKLADLPASPIYRGHPEKNMVSLHINVSWGTEHIPDILEVLEEEQVKATFFVEGKWAKENPNVLKMIHEKKHVIGNHAYNHPDMATLTRQEMKEQISETNSIIHAIIGEDPIWFSPPSGSFNQTVVEVASELEMETILWTVDTVDWKKPSVSVMINRVISKIHPGATVLMHPTEPVVQGLKQMITEIKEKNYKIDTIDSLLSESR